MQVRVLHQFKHPPCLIVVMEMDAELVVYMPEAFDAAILSGGDDPPCFREFRFAAPDILRVIELVIPSVFQRAVGVYPRFMGKGVCADTRLGYRNGYIKSV